MEGFADLLKAFATVLWAGLAFYIFWSLRSTIVKLLESRSINIKIAGNEINLPQATASIGAAVADIQARLAAMGEAAPPKPGPGAGTMPEHIADHSAPELEAAFPSAATEATARTAHILWVDDDPSNNAFLIDRLRGSGHSIDLSTSTADALQRLAHQAYDGVISDLGRKEGGVENPMAGRDLITEMREAGFTPPVLVFGGTRAVQLRKDLIAAGARGVTNSGIDVIAFVDACAGARPS